MKNKLTPKQDLFCREYLIDYNGSAAVLRAGYKTKSPDVMAAQLLSNTKCQLYIDKLSKKRVNKITKTMDDVTNEWIKIGFSSIAHLHNTWIERKEFETLTDSQKDCIQEIYTRTRIELNDSTGESFQIEEVKIKLYDKQKALENLTKIFGGYATERVDHTSKGKQIETLVILPRTD